jgi:hypothetical protein
MMPDPRKMGSYCFIASTQKSFMIFENHLMGPNLATAMMPGPIKMDCY